MATITDRYVLEVETDQATRRLGNTTGAVGGLAAGLGRIGPLAGAAVAALGGFAAIQGITNTIDSMDELAKSARLAGAAASEDAFRGFQVLQQAMSEAGIDAATFDRAMLQTTSRLQEGVEGGEAFAGIVDKMGDRIRNADGTLVDGATALQEMINALNEGTISTDEFAKVVGGRAGPLIQQQFASLNTSAEDLQATLADVEANSNIINLDAANNAEVFNDTMGRLGEQLGRVGTQIVEKLLPHLVELAENVLANMPAFIDGVSQAFETLEPLFSLIGTVATELVVPALQLLFEVLGTIAAAIAPLVDAAIPALKTGFETLGAIVESIIQFFQRAADTLGAVYDRAVQLKGAVTGQFSEMTDGMVNSAQEAYDGVTGWFNGMYDYVVGNSVVPDMADGVLAVFEHMNRGMVQSTAQGTSSVERQFDGIARNIAGGYQDITRSAMGTIDSLVNNLTNGLFNKLQGLSRSVSSSFGGIFSGISGIFGGGGGGGFLDNLFGGIGDLFAGFFANGGFIPAGQFGVVGERGPEFVSGPAQVTPMSGGQPTQLVTYNINAVDARSFRNLIAEDPKFIHAVAQRGARTLGRA